jgi:hypothetical protein
MMAKAIMPITAAFLPLAGLPPFADEVPEFAGAAGVDAADGVLDVDMGSSPKEGLKNWS